MIPAVNLTRDCKQHKQCTIAPANTAHATATLLIRKWDDDSKSLIWFAIHPNILKFQQNGRHLVDVIFNGKYKWFAFHLRFFFLVGSICNKSLWQVRISYRNPRHMPLPEPMLTSVISWGQFHGNCSGYHSRHTVSLQWRQNERGGVSNHQRLDCLTSKLRVTGPLWGESTGDRWIALTKGQ